MTQDTKSQNPFCFPICGYYCDDGKSCSCTDCKEFWDKVPEDDDWYEWWNNMDDGRSERKIKASYICRVWRVEKGKGLYFMKYYSSILKRMATIEEIEIAITKLAKQLEEEEV